jgi:hypothetical protein
MGCSLVQSFVLGFSTICEPFETLSRFSGKVCVAMISSILGAVKRRLG